MPEPNQIHPNQKRERMLFESDDAYAERMKHLDWQDSLIASLATKKELE